MLTLDTDQQIPIAAFAKTSSELRRTMDSWVCRGQSKSPAERVCQKRQRVEFSDAAKIRERVQANAAQLRLRGARAHVLAAVLKLLCGWSKITDDRVGLPQVVELSRPPGAAVTTSKRSGATLAGLAADELIVYRPAQGRGRRAFIAIHDRFVADIEGAPQGPFRAGNHRLQLPLRHRFRHLFRPPPYKDQTHYPPTPRSQTQPRATRPSGVMSARGISARCCGGFHRRWRGCRGTYGGCSAGKSASAWRPVGAPIRSSRCWRRRCPPTCNGRGGWRCGGCATTSWAPDRGYGPLQQAWDAQASAAGGGRRGHHRALVRRRGRGDHRRTARRAAARRRGEIRAGSAEDPVAALAAAGRRVARLFPEMPLTAALARWAEDILASQNPKPLWPSRFPR